MTTKLNFYTERKFGPLTRFYGKCRELTNICYGPVNTRDAALSGIRRLAKKTKVVTSTKQKVNRITLLLDTSGSMRPILNAAVDALNKNIRTIREQSLKTRQQSLVTVVLFNTSTRVIRDTVPASNLTEVSYHEASQFSGGTALLDAVGGAITKLQGAYVPANEDVSYLVMTVTDGQELDSTRFDARSLNNLMKIVQKTDRWTLTFLVPQDNKEALVREFQIPDGNVAEWEQTKKGIESYTQLDSFGLGTYFAARTNGQTSTKAFYQTDLSGVSTKQIKSQLDDISSQVRVLPVDKEQDIRTFVEGKLGKYTTGSAFYQLTKDEKTIQGYKDLLVMEKGKRAVFGGSDARDVLGIPDGDLKVRPGNHANFDLFVQSNSTNRKLVRGTKLIVKT